MPSTKYNNTVKRWEKTFRQQMREIKYSLIEKQPEGRELSDAEKEEYRKLARFMSETARFLTGKKAHEAPIPVPKILIPTMTIKMKSFIKENCPLYTSRLKK